jgi:hypothetical protein
VRSWEVELVKSAGWLTPIRDWYFDSETLLPLRVEMRAAAATQAIDYTHTHVNQAMADEQFRPGPGADVKDVAAEPLAKGYTRRFLNVNDGSAGRMSVRWGMKGPAGWKSGGLN